VKRLSLTLIVVVLAMARTALGGTWTNQFQQMTSDTSIISIAAATESKAVAFGGEPDGQGNSKMVWLRTSDGKTWQKQDVTGQEMLILSHLACPSETRCWAVGMSINMQTMGIKNLLMGSVNGGEIWFKAPPLNYSISRLAIRDETNMWLVGGSVVVPVVDGKSKTAFVPKIEGEPFKTILDAAFVGENTVFAVNGESQQDDNGEDIGILPKGALLRSDDGGTNWVAVFRDRQEKPTRVRFFTQKTGFIMGEAAQGPFLRRTDDGGATWLDITLPTPASVPVPSSLDDMVIFNSMAGLFLGSGKDGNGQTYHVVYRMKDGHTLLEEPLPDNKLALFAITCPSQKVCWIAGENFSIWRFEGTDADVVSDDTPLIGDPGGGTDLIGTDLVGLEAVIPDQAAGDGSLSVEGGGVGSSGGGGCASGGPAGGGSSLLILALALLFMSHGRWLRGV